MSQESDELLGVITEICRRRASGKMRADGIDELRIRFGRALRDWRASVGIGQRVLAEQVEAHEVSIYKWEQGGIPQNGYLFRLSAVVKGLGELPIEGRRLSFMERHKELLTTCSLSDLATEVVRARQYHGLLEEIWRCRVEAERLINPDFDPEKLIG